MKSRTIGSSWEKVPWLGLFVAALALSGCDSGDVSLAEANCEKTQWVLAPDSGDSLAKVLAEAKKCSERTFSIHLGAGTYSPSELLEEPSGPAAFPEIEGEVSIRGAGDVRIEAPDPAEQVLFRLFNVGEKGSLTLRGVKLAGGHGNLGGAIYNAGRLRMVDVDIENSRASEAGGAIYNRGELSIRGGTLRANRAGGDAAGIGPARGGALFVAEESLARLQRVTLLENQAADGGALYAEGVVEIIESSLRLNRARQGGAAFVARGPLLLRRSSLVENEARQNGGGLMIAVSAASHVETSTFSNNTAFGSGGGLFSDGRVELVGTTVYGNWARPGREGGGLATSESGAVFASASVIAGSRSGGDCRLSGALRLEDRNFSGDGSCPDFEIAEDDRYLLRDLGDNGGPTPTHLPWDGGELIDARLGDCEGKDQRGLPRGDDGDGDGRRGCDIGAAELRTSERR